MPIFKTDIINWLGRKYGLSSYLEICASTTGLRYGAIDREHFGICERLMYCTPTQFSDGRKVDYVFEGSDFSRTETHNRVPRDKYDIILVDPYHSYELSYRDLSWALSRINRRGFVIVHDCLPPARDYAMPQFRPGMWCGVTYAAFIDKMFDCEELLYCTINTDMGCGIICWADTPNLKLELRNSAHEPIRSLKGRWLSLKDFDERYEFLQKYKQILLNLTSVEEFISRERLHFPYYIKKLNTAVSIGAGRLMSLAGRSPTTKITIS